MSSTLDLGGNAPAGPAPGAGDLVKDATIETFQADVLEASMAVPVVVDFWATWCGPCKTLGPILEKAVQARGGKVKMVKVDTDKNQMLAQQLRIQSLPTVMAFVGGQPVDGFMGAVPDSEVQVFLDRIIAAAEQMGLKGDAPGAVSAKDLIAAGKEALAQNAFPQAIQAFAEAAGAADEGSDEQLEAIAGIAHVQLAAGDLDAARATIDQVPDDKRGHAALAQITAQLQLMTEPAANGDLGAAEVAFRADPSNQEQGFAFAEAQIAAGRVEPAMDTLLTLIGKDREWNEGAARQKLLTLFEALGAAHPEVKRARRRLSSLLFS
ncbi:MAG: thioredoxin [Pseudomonadota bacterium]